MLSSGFDWEFILLLLINTVISLALFTLSIIYFFTEAARTTRETGKKTIMASALICAAAILNAIITRYAVTFPETELYDMNSDFIFITNIITAIIGFFTYICYIRAGQSLAFYGGIPGSLLLAERTEPVKISWKWILFPMPLLIFWSFICFAIFPADPTELVYATTPEGDGIMVYVYAFLSTAVLAPVQEEILYRHFIMGLFSKWFGSSKLAVALNIGLSALIFSIAHAGIVTEDWIKILQVLPLGILFGVINRKKGLEHSVLTHSLFNTVIMIISMLFEK